MCNLRAEKALEITQKGFLDSIPPRAHTEKYLKNNYASCLFPSPLKASLIQTLMPNGNPTVSAGPSFLCLALGKSKSLPFIAEESRWLPERASGDGTCGGRNVGGGSATHKNPSPQVGVYRLLLSTTAHLFSYAYVPARQCRRKTVTAVTWP